MNSYNRGDMAINENYSYKQNYLSYGKITTVIFLIIMFLFPATLLFKLIELLLTGSAGDFFLTQSSPSSIFDSYLILLIPTVVLAIWSFLREPISLIRRYKMAPLIIERPELANRILSWKDNAFNNDKTDLLLIPEDTPSVFAFGTWRHKYIAIANGAISLWPEPELQAVVLHEYGHLVSGDAWKAGFATEYIKWYIIVNLILGTVSTAIKMLLNYGLLHINLYNIVIQPLANIVVGLFLILTLRYIFRLREFNADIFASAELNNNKPLIDAFGTYLSLDWIRRKPQKLAFMFEGIQTRLTKILGFHPSAIKRLNVLQDPSGLVGETFGLAGIAGLTVAVIITWFWNQTTLPILVGGMVMTSVPIILFLIPDINLSDKLSSLIHLLRRAFAFSSGVSLVWIFVAFFAYLVETNFNDSASHFLTGGQLRYYLALNLDYLVLILIAIPILITCLAYLAVLITKFVPETFHSNNKNRLLLILSWLIELPFVFVLVWAFVRWWNGHIISIYSFGALLGASIILAPLILLFLHFYIWSTERRKNNRT